MSIFSPGAWVRAKYTTTVNGGGGKRMQLVVGDIGKVLKFDDDGDARVAFHGFKEGWVIRDEWKHFESVPPGDVEDAKKLVLVEGSQVQVLKSFKSEVGQNPVTLVLGETGVVEKIDEDGDALIKFTTKQWIKRKNFPDLYVGSRADIRMPIFSPGAWVRAKYTTTVNGGGGKRMQLVVGDIGKVLKFDDDGDARVAFHGFKEGWVVRDEWKHFESVPPGDVEDAKKLVLVKGSQVEVLKSFKSEVGQNPVTLVLGETGVVEKIDEDGDAQIQFTTIGSKQWIKRKNFPDINPGPAAEAKRKAAEEEAKRKAAAEAEEKRKSAEEEAKRKAGPRAALGLAPSASDEEVAQAQKLKAYIVTPSGSEMKRWLLSKGFDENDRGRILLQFLKPEYEVKTLLELFALEDADIDEILQGLPLAKRRVLKASIKQDRDGF